MSDPKPLQRRSFDDIRRGHWRSSLAVFLLILFIYAVAVGLLLGAVMATLWLFALPGWLSGPTPQGMATFALISLALATIIAAAHFWEARYQGAKTILGLLRAREPDPSDRFHLVYVDTTQEMALAAGLPRVRTYVLPTHAVNSIALIASDGAPIVAVSEGMLAECDRDELQAAVAHELAHILSGDTFYVTLVCSLAAFIDKIRESLEPDTSLPNRGRSGNDGPAFPLVYFVAWGMSNLLHGLTALISRERELLADAAAADFTRHPDALARVIYKAQLSYSFIGDFSQSVAPLFIVAPESEADEAAGFLDRLFASHPPVERRVASLAKLAHCEMRDVVKAVWDSRKRHEAARPLLDVVEAAAVPGDPAVDAEEADRLWQVRDAHGEWRGPFTPTELAAQSYYTPRLLVRMGPEGMAAMACEFPRVVEAVRALRSGSGAAARAASGRRRCPRCAVPLTESHYEGVAVLACGACGGRLLRSRDDAQKAIVRREVGFAPPLVERAMDTARKLMVNPRKIGSTPVDPAACAACPSCGAPMAARPFNYQYFLPIDECLSCGSIWFDANELEYLQIWVENDVSLGAAQRARRD